MRRPWGDGVGDCGVVPRTQPRMGVPGLGNLARRRPRTPRIVAITGKKRGTFRPGARSNSCPAPSPCAQGESAGGGTDPGGDSITALRAQGSSGRGRAVGDRSALTAEARGDGQGNSPVAHDSPGRARPHGATPRSALRALGQGVLPSRGTHGGQLRAAQCREPARTGVRRGCRSIYQDRQREDRSPSAQARRAPGNRNRSRRRLSHGTASGSGLPKKPCPMDRRRGAGREPALSRP